MSPITDHLPEAAALAFLDQAREERPADAAAMRGGVDIDRILDGVAIGRSRAVGAGVGVAEHGVVLDGDEMRVAA